MPRYGFEITTVRKACGFVTAEDENEAIEMIHNQNWDDISEEHQMVVDSIDEMYIEDEYTEEDED